MNLSATAPGNAHFNAGAPSLRQRYGAMIAGLALSLLVHGILLGWWKPHFADDNLPANAGDAARLLIRLMPPEIRRADTHPRQSPLNPSPASERDSVHGTSVEPAAQSDAAERPAFLAEPGTAIDLEAARHFARRMAKDTAAAGRSPDDPTQRASPDESEPETALGRSIARTTRPKCTEQFANYGLLAPLAHAFHLATDARDTGCKY
jgi:hypothetical protein